MKKAKSLSLSAYIEQALKMAEYEKNENGVVVASVPNISGFFSQGENFEEARNNLRDAIEGNLLVALQLGFEIPEISVVEISDFDYSDDVFENAWTCLIQRFHNTLSHRNFPGPQNPIDFGLLVSDRTDEPKLRTFTIKVLGITLID
jgi:predicted RNase H-like HicB family nuclease